MLAIGNGALLIAGQEEDGTLELDLTAPVSGGNLLAGRLLVALHTSDGGVSA